jgi:hypothetical protein
MDAAVKFPRTGLSAAQTSAQNPGLAPAAANGPLNTVTAAANKRIAGGGTIPAGVTLAVPGGAVLAAAGTPAAAAATGTASFAVSGGGKIAAAGAGAADVKSAASLGEINFSAVEINFCAVEINFCAVGIIFCAGEIIFSAAVTSFRAAVTSFRAVVTGFRAAVTGFRAVVTGFRAAVTSFRAVVTGFRAAVAAAAGPALAVAVSRAGLELETALALLNGAALALSEDFAVKAAATGGTGASIRTAGDNGLVKPARATTPATNGSKVEGAVKAAGTAKDAKLKLAAAAAAPPAATVPVTAVTVKKGTAVEAADSIAPAGAKVEGADGKPGIATGTGGTLTLDGGID